MGLVQLQVVLGCHLLALCSPVPFKGVCPPPVHGSLCLLQHGDKLMSCTMSRCWDIHPRSWRQGQTFLISQEFLCLAGVRKCRGEKAQ